jgi:hypothetical protein
MLAMQDECSQKLQSAKTCNSMKQIHQKSHEKNHQKSHQSNKIIFLQWDLASIDCSLENKE